MGSIVDARISPIPKYQKSVADHCQKDPACAAIPSFNIFVTKKASRTRPAESLVFQYCWEHASSFCVRYGICLYCGVHFSKSEKSDVCGPCSRKKGLLELGKPAQNPGSTA